jgi:hypothetical protein
MSDSQTGRPVSRLNWIIPYGVLAFLAASLFLTGLWANKIDTKHRDQRPEQAQSGGSRQEDPASRTLAPSAKKDEPILSQAVRERGTQQSEWWNVKSTDLAVAVFTGFLLIATALQAAWTRAAVRAAERSANIANNSLTKLERAFVVQKRFDTRAGVTADKQQILRIGCVLENSGSTPTQHCIIKMNVGVFAKELTDTFEFFDVEGEDAIRSVIGPKSTSQTEALNVLMSEVENATKGTVAIYFWGWAEYDDIFDGTSRHRTEFCFRLVDYKGPLSQGNLTFETHRVHNGLDDECPHQRWRTGKGGVWNEPRLPSLPRTRVV